MIKSITLINWRSHKETRLQFHKGTNLIMGIMGAGKSSIMEALSFGLFGTFPTLERRKVKLEDVVRLNESSAKVIVELVWDEIVYKVERRIEKGKRGTSADADIYKNSSLAEHGQTAVTTYIINLLGVDYDLFTRAIYSEQNNMDYFLTLDPRKRKEEIDRLLGLDKFEEARANLVSVINHIVSKKRTLSENFRQERLNELHESSKLQEIQLEECRKRSCEERLKHNTESDSLGKHIIAFEEMKAAKQISEKLEPEKISLIAKKNALAKDLGNFDPAEYEKIKASAEALASEHLLLIEKLRQQDALITTLASSSGSIESRIKKLHDTLSRKFLLTKELTELSNGATYAQLMAELESRELAFKETETTIEVLNKKTGLLRNIVAILPGGSYSELLNKINDLDLFLLAAQSEAKSTEDELKDLDDLLGRLKSDSALCPLCEHPLTTDKISHIKEERTIIIAKKRSRIDELRSLLPSKSMESSELKQKSRKLTALFDQLKELGESVAQNSASKPEIQFRLNELEKELEVLRNSRDLNSVELEKLKIRTKKHSIICEQIKLLENDVKGEEELKLSKNEIESKLKDSELKRAELRSISDNLAKSLERSRSSVADFENRQKRKAELDAIEKRLSYVSSQLASIRFDSKSFEELRKTIEDLRLSLEKVSSECRFLDEKIKNHLSVLKLICHELVGLRKTESELKKITLLENELSLYKLALMETQATLRNELIDAITNAMNEIWAMFYPYKNYSRLRLLVSEKDYIFEVDDANAWKTLESTASGGERATAALALRVAMAMVLTPKLSWLILDEPTHNLDSAAVELLSNTLQSRIPEVVSQTFVITHEEKLMGSDFACSYRLTRDKSTNGPTTHETL